MSTAHVQVLGSVIQSGTNTTTIIGSLTKTVTVGNTIMVGWAAYRANVAVSGVTDNLGNSYALGEDGGQYSDGAAAELWYAPVTSGGTLTTITITHASENAAQSAIASEFSGVGTLAGTGGGTAASSAGPATIGSRTIPANGLSVWATAANTNQNQSAGAASGSPSTSPALSYFLNGDTGQSASIVYAIAGASEVSGFTGTTTFAASTTWATAGAQFNSNATGPVWTTPADTVSMSTTPDLKFTSPVSAAKQHFYLQLDTANTFDTGNLRNLDSSTSQTNWTYYNGSSWVAIPSDGLPIAYSGNEVCYTVTSALSATTWYRRVRAGTLV